VNNKLNQLRVKIDGADRALLKALGVRFKAVKELGYLKKKLRMPIVQKSRWNQVMKDRLKKAKKVNLSRSFTKAIFNLIQDEAIRIQKKR